MKTSNVDLLKHIFRRSVRSIWENLYLNTVAAGVIAASLLLIGVYVSVLINLGSIVDTWNKDVHISAYFSSEISDQEHLQLRDKLFSLPQTEEVRYVNQQDAHDWLTQRVEGIEDTLEDLGENALPASLEISLKAEASNPKEIESFVSILREQGFNEIDYGVEWVEKFNAFLHLLKVLGILLGGLIIISAIFLVTNTVHLVIYNRRREMEIAKLVGASKTFILLPFLFEGIIQGIIGSLAAITGLWIIHQSLAVRLQKALVLEIAGKLHFLNTNQLLLLMMAGVVLGLAAAYIASRRFIGQAP